jgi:integrase
MAVEITQALIKRLRAEAAATGKRIDVSDSKSSCLQLRVTASTATWCLRGKQGGAQWRLPIGSTDLWTIPEARRLASKATGMIRDKLGRPTEAWLDEQRKRAGKVYAPSLQGARLGKVETWSAWTYKAARERYLEDFVASKRRPATLVDVRNVLGGPDLRKLDGERIPDITRKRIATIVDEVHRSGRERAAEKIVEVVRPFWAWLAGDPRQDKSGIKSDVMSTLELPERSRLKPGERPKSAYVPPMSEIGAYVAIARAPGVLEPTIAAAVQLLVYTCQRRRPVALARVDEFVEVKGHGGLWNMPPANRKTADNWGDVRDHAVPLPHSIWTVVVEQIERAGVSPWLFPAIRPQKAADHTDSINPDTLSHVISDLPGPGTAHRLRTAFATHGEEVLGMSRGDIQAILDHAEGGRMSGVTARYALSNGSHFKWPLMARWTGAVDAAVAEAQKTLGTPAELSAAIYGRRRKSPSGDIPARPAPTTPKSRRTATSGYSAGRRSTASAG